MLAENDWNNPCYSTIFSKKNVNKIENIKNEEWVSKYYWISYAPHVQLVEGLVQIFYLIFKYNIVLEFELRKAKETIQELRQNITEMAGNYYLFVFVDYLYYFEKNFISKISFYSI